MRWTLVGLITLLTVAFAGLLVLINAGSAFLTPARLFASADCMPPCWQGIELERTTAEEAFTLLADHPYVESGSLHSTVENGRGVIFWQMIDDVLSPSRTVSGQAFVRDGKVDRLVLSGHFRLGDLIASLGSPAEIYAVIVEATGTNVVTAIAVTYPELGIVAVQPSGSLNRLSPELTMEHLFIQTQPTSLIPLQLSGSLGWQGVQTMMAWRGFAPARYLTPTNQ